MEEMDEIFNIVENPNICPTLTIASFDICGNNEKEDIVEILNAILKYKPDILAIQGLTRENCDTVFRNMKSQSYTYSRFDQTGNPRPEFEILFSHNDIPILKREYTRFIRTEQNRGISKYLITVGSHTQNPIDVWIFTSQLERGAPGNAIRKIQIMEIGAEYKRVSFDQKHPINPIPVVFAGDTCIPSWQEHSLRCPDGWFDAWREKGTSQNEKTSLYDRTDQIWFSSGDLEHIPSTITILDFTKIRISSSDDIRAGVCATFAVK